MADLFQRPPVPKGTDYGYQAGRRGPQATPRRGPALINPGQPQSTLPLAENLLKQKKRKGGGSSRPYGEEQEPQEWDPEEEPAPETEPEAAPAGPSLDAAQQMHPTGGGAKVPPSSIPPASTTSRIGEFQDAFDQGSLF